MSEKLPAILPDTGEIGDPLVPVPLEALDAIERSRIDLQIAAARRNPRASIAVIEKRIRERATRRADVAELCYYSLPRYDKEEGRNKLITGASIKLANIALGEWGNTLSGARTVGNDGKVIKAYGICWDLESNNQKFTEVQRRIIDKNGRPYSYDMQVQTAGAANSVAERNAILKVLGSDLYEPLVAECMKVVAGTASDFTERRDKALKWFNLRGVKYDQILELVEKDAIDKLEAEDVAYLSGLANAIKDKEITVEEAFPRADSGELPSKVKLRDKLLAQRAAREKEKA